MHSFGQGTQWGKITLWDAAADGDLEMCKLRMKSAVTHVNAKDAQGKTALHEAARWGHTNVIEFLLDNKAELEARTNEGSTPLHLAAMNGKDDAVRFLISKGADINCVDNYKDTPLMAASGAGQVNTVQLLLGLGADRTLLNSNGRTAENMAKDPTTADVFNDAAYQSPTKY
ncbi:Poly [ADP-ribose] polymerase tankyrase-2 [Balamuthia mandrillaris]